jgi:F0F1-type ATP synthase assembly protein I
MSAPPVLGPLQKATRAAAAVMEMAILTLGGLLLGAWLDTRFGCAPLLLIVFLLAAFAIGVIRLRVLLSRLDPPE